MTLRLVFPFVIVAATAVAQPRFEFDTGRRWFPLRGTSPAAVASGDFDEDGDPDVAITDFTGDLTLYWNDGLGNLAEGPSVHVDDVTRSLVVADLDRDGHIDVAVDASHGGVSNGGRLVALFGDGTGGFPRRVATALPVFAAGGLAALDLDGDGWLDLVVTMPEQNVVGVLPSDGSGGWGGMTLHPSGSSPGRFAAGDVNGDGRIDLVVANLGGATGAAAVLLGDGAGGFAAPTTFATAVSPLAVALADLDGDGRLDAAFTHYPQEVGASVHFGNGNGGFGPRQTLPGNLFRASDLETADFDGDGISDLAVLTYESNGDQYKIFRTNGAGGFVRFATATAGEAAQDGGVVDLDRDSRLDFMIANRLSRDIAVDLGTGRSGFRAGIAHSGRMGGTNDLVLADLDENGILDVVSTRNAASDLAAFVGDGGGAFHEGPLASTGGRVGSLVAADFDGDGHIDVAAADYAGDAVATLFGDGAGGLGDLRHLPAGLKPRAIATADFDEDGLPDLAIADDGGECTFSSCLPDGGIAILLSDGSRGFTRRIDVGTPDRGFSIVVTGDFDEDGHTDLVVHNGRAGLALYRGSGLGGFTGLGTISSLANVSAVIARDLDGDGHLDLAFTQAEIRQPGLVHVARGFGDGSFGPVSSVAIAEEPRSIAAADFDLDGRLDLAVGCGFFIPFAGPVALLAGDGLGGFTLSTHVGGTWNPRAMRVADLDLDGQPDIVQATGNQEYLGATSFEVLFDRTGSFLLSRRGNVNRRASPPVDVLFVNGASGDADERRVMIASNGVLDIAMFAPPSRPSGPSRFWLGLWAGEPTRTSMTTLPSGTGPIGMATYLSDARPPRLVRLWNNIGRENLLGRPNSPSLPAPSRVFRREVIGREFTVYLQGILVDRNAPNGRAAVTNGIILQSRHP